MSAGAPPRGWRAGGLGPWWTRGTRTWELGRLRLHRTLSLRKPTTRGFLRQVHVHRGLLARGQGGESADHQDAQADPEHHLEEKRPGARAVGTGAPGGQERGACTQTPWSARAKLFLTALRLGSRQDPGNPLRQSRSPPTAEPRPLRLCKAPHRPTGLAEGGQCGSTCPSSACRRARTHTRQCTEPEAGVRLNRQTLELSLHVRRKRLAPRSQGPGWTREELTLERPSLPAYKPPPGPARPGVTTAAGTRTGACEAEASSLPGRPEATPSRGAFTDIDSNSIPNGTKAPAAPPVRAGETPQPRGSWGPVHTPPGPEAGLRMGNHETAGSRVNIDYLEPSRLEELTVHVKLKHTAAPEARGRDMESRRPRARPPREE